MKIALTVFAAFAMLLGHAAVTKAFSIDTRAKGPGLSCAPPNWFSARSDPLSRTNHYEFSGECTNGAEGPGGNPITTVAAGRVMYTITSDWSCNSQKAVERFSISTFKSRAKVVSYCPADPWINAVSCKSGAIQWITNHLDTSGLGGVFPLTSNHINRAALRKQLLANSTRPRIAAPKEYQKFNNAKDIFIVIKAALPCGIGVRARSAVLMIEKEKDIPEGSSGWASETWVDAGTRKVRITHDFGIAKLANLSAGTWRVKVRVISPNLGAPSYWRTFDVNSTSRIHFSKSLMSLLPVMVSSTTKSPIVQAPKQNQLFVNQGVLFQVSQTSKRPDYSRWEYVFEWKRADYHTKANNAYAKQKWEQTNHGKHSYVPPALGLNSSLQLWLSPIRLQTMAEGGTAHMNFSALRSHRPDSSYLYQLRVREHSLDSKAYGPWSPWRGFIVQEPYRISMPRFMGSLGQKQGKQQFGQQQSRHFAPMARVRRLNRPVQRLPRSKQAVGLRHGMRQRGVQKKLAPVAPVQRMKLAPVAPARRRSLPAMQLRAR